MNYEGRRGAAKPQLESVDVRSTSTVNLHPFLLAEGEKRHTSKFKHQTLTICTHQTKS
jgi:hypothetical protein